jgi:PEP-CTERM motif
MRNKFYLCVVASFLGLLGSINAATLVNDFSGSVTGYNFTSSFADAFAMSSPSAWPTASGATGQVDVGYYTVNYRDMPNFNTGVWSIVNGYSGDMGNYDGDTGFYTGGTYFDLAGVTGFLVSLRKESFNTSTLVDFYILTNRDTEIYLPIDISGLSSAGFTDVMVDLAGNAGYSYIPNLKAVTIGIRGNSFNDSSAGASTYNFSVDSLRVVPEPSSSLLILSGLSALALLRRRFR